MAKSTLSSQHDFWHLSLTTSHTVVRGARAGAPFVCDFFSLWPGEKEIDFEPSVFSCLLHSYEMFSYKLLLFYEEGLELPDLGVGLNEINEVSALI